MLFLRHLCLLVFQTKSVSGCKPLYTYNGNLIFQPWPTFQCQQSILPPELSVLQEVIDLLIRILAVEISGCALCAVLYYTVKLHIDFMDLLKLFCNFFENQLIICHVQSNNGKSCLISASQMWRFSALSYLMVKFGLIRWNKEFKYTTLGSWKS